MTVDPKDDKKQEIDADDMIRQYEEGEQMSLEALAGEREDEIEWHDQAIRDTPVPEEAVVSGGDIDAAWSPTATGEETVGGSNPTPDQDLVDEIGAAVGVTYEEGEPIDPDGKMEPRDAERWELNPASAEDYAQRTGQAEQASTDDERTQGDRPASSEDQKRAA
jgi:hypothetical protein